MRIIVNCIYGEGRVSSVTSCRMYQNEYNEVLIRFKVLTSAQQGSYSLHNKVQGSHSAQQGSCSLHSKVQGSHSAQQGSRFSLSAQ